MMTQHELVQIRAADWRNRAGDCEEPGEAERNTEWDAGLSSVKKAEKAGG